MSKRLSKFQMAQQKAEAAAKRTNQKIKELGYYTNELYSALTTIQALFDCIRNVPEENWLRYEKLKAIRVNWKQQAERIELEYRRARSKAAGQGAAGVGAGVAVAALGPTVAMGVATTFGVASTGTAISALSGAAATNAALAWLGGGALAAGGGGMAAGSAFLALAGPVGWTIAGVSMIASGLMFFKAKNDKEKLEDLFTLISERDVKSFELAIVELNERIERIVDEKKKLEEAIVQTRLFGTDYGLMSEKQRYELGAYVNLMQASTTLLVDPILGLQPKYSAQDIDQLCAVEDDVNRRYFMDHTSMVIPLANLLYMIKLDGRDKTLLAKSMQRNKDFLTSVQMAHKKLGVYDITMVERALNHRYRCLGEK